MKTTTFAALACAFLVSVCLQAAEMPQMPPPVKEHEWLKKFVGEWDTSVEVYMEPGKPPMTCKGSETAKMIGGFWIIGEGKAEMMGMPMSSVITLGYDPAKKKYIGTWIDGMSSYLWQYEGTVDEAGNKLTLESTGPCPKTPGKLREFRETVEFKSPDHRIFTSSIKEDDGKWVMIVKGEYTRKK
jgi:hypothetical protein